MRTYIVSFIYTRYVGTIPMRMEVTSQTDFKGCFDLTHFRNEMIQQLNLPENTALFITFMYEIQK